MGILCMFTSFTYAQNLNITPIYEVIKNTNPDSWEDKFTMVKEIPIVFSKNQIVKIKKLKNDYTEWQISDGKNNGKLTFGYENDHLWWDYSFKGETLKIATTGDGEQGFNDPRLLMIASTKDTVFIQNQEPDCNSNFVLVKDSEAKYGDPNLGSSQAKKPCQKTSWSFKLKNELTEHQQVAFIFISVVSMTVRYMPYLNKKED